MKIVLDTNVIVSALLCPQSLPAKILGLVLDGIIKIAYDNNILAEYIDVLNRQKFKINKDLIKIVLDCVTNEGEFTISMPQNMKFVDDDDKVFYELDLFSNLPLPNIPNLGYHKNSRYSVPSR